MSQRRSTTTPVLPAQHAPLDTRRASGAGHETQILTTTRPKPLLLLLCEPHQRKTRDARCTTRTHDTHPTAWRANLLPSVEALRSARARSPPCSDPHDFANMHTGVDMHQPATRGDSSAVRDAKISFSEVGISPASIMLRVSASTTSLSTTGEDQLCTTHIQRAYFEELIDGVRMWWAAVHCVRLLNPSTCRQIPPESTESTCSFSQSALRF
ncbi:hypothetical protein B0H11DRAFT_2400665 [Mycena galericulata]|nr:hypothetical protein B0H11DRAFT_2400665 [Mycena galericulata]